MYNRKILKTIAYIAVSAVMIASLEIIVPAPKMVELPYYPNIEVYSPACAQSKICEMHMMRQYLTNIGYDTEFVQNLPDSALESVFTATYRANIAYVDMHTIYMSRDGTIFNEYENSSAPDLRITTVAAVSTTPTDSRIDSVVVTVTYQWLRLGLTHHLDSIWVSWDANLFTRSGFTAHCYYYTRRHGWNLSQTQTAPATAVQDGLRYFAHTQTRFGHPSNGYLGMATFTLLPRVNIYRHDDNPVRAIDISVRYEHNANHFRFIMLSSLVFALAVLMYLYYSNRRVKYIHFLNRYGTATRQMNLRRGKRVQVLVYGCLSLSTTA